MTNRIRVLIGALLLECSQAWATTNIEIIVPFPAGGPNDHLARILAKELEKRQEDFRIIVSNRVGGDGVVAVKNFLSGPANSIMIAGTGTTVFAKLMNPNLPYDPLRDLAIYGPITLYNQMVVVSSKSNIKNLDDFINKGKNQNLVCGTNSATGVFYGRYIATKFNLNMVLVSYKGSAPVMTDLIGGHIDCSIDVLSQYAGRDDIRFIAGSKSDVTGHAKVPVVSPTQQQFGGWIGFALHAQMDDRLKDRILRAMADIVNDRQFIQLNESKGVEVNRDFTMQSINPRLNREYEFLVDFRRKFIDPAQ